MRIWFITMLALLIASSASAQTPGEVAATPEAVPTLHRSGGLRLGISVEPPYFGSIQAITAFGHVAGFDMGAALQVEISKHWSVRLPVELGFGGLGRGDGAGYLELAVIPGFVYRFRHANDQRLVGYVGGGTRLGVGGIGVVLVNRPLTVACCDSDWGDGGSSDPNTEGFLIGLSPEAWFGLEVHLSRWVSLNFAGSFGFQRALSTNVFVLRETVGLRLTI